MNWYKKEKNKLDKIDYLPALSRYGGSDFYKVNIRNAKKYVNVLRQSEYFSKKFIDSLSNYFVTADNQLQQLKQNDGPPTGFDFDLIFKTQEIDSYLLDLSKAVYEINQTNLSTIKVNFYVYPDRKDIGFSFMLDSSGKIVSIKYIF